MARASEDAIEASIERHCLIFIKPVFKGGIGKKGKAGLIDKATDLATALVEKERLHFAEHRHGNVSAKSNGLTFETGIPAEHKVYFSITDSTVYRAPTMTLTHKGGVDIEELDFSEFAQVPFDASPALRPSSSPTRSPTSGRRRRSSRPLSSSCPNYGSSCTITA